MTWQSALGWVAAAGAAYAWVPHFGHPFLARRRRCGARALALTFDDGPDPHWTPRISDRLVQLGVPGTFFVVGERAAAQPSMIRDLALAGHELANHSWSHPCLWLCGPGRTAREVGRTHALIEELTGRAPRFFRPPWGMLNAALWPVLRLHGEKLVLWTIQPEGLRPVPPRSQLRRVIARAAAGAIVDLHDAPGLAGAPERLFALLPELVRGLQDRGFTLSTVTALRSGVGSHG